MIIVLAGKYRKLVAGFLAGVFYLQLVLPLYARAEIPDTDQYRKSPWPNIFLKNLIQSMK